MGSGNSLIKGAVVRHYLELVSHAGSMGERERIEGTEW